MHPKKKLALPIKNGQVTSFLNGPRTLRISVVAWLNRLIYRIEKTVVSSCMIVMAVILLASVAFRHLNIVMVGGEEIAQFTVVWMTFWGMALCARKGNHIVMSAVLDKIPTKRRKAVIAGHLSFQQLLLPAADRICLPADL